MLHRNPLQARHDFRQFVRMWVPLAMLIACVMLIVGAGYVRDAHGASWLYAMQRDIGTNPTGWGSRWCGRYLDMRVPGKWSNKASANINHGKPSACKKGAVAVMSNHVGVVVSCSKTACSIVSGNGRNGLVDQKSYSRSRIIGCRWPG